MYFIPNNRNAYFSCIKTFTSELLSLVKWSLDNERFTELDGPSTSQVATLSIKTESYFVTVSSLQVQRLPQESFAQLVSDLCHAAEKFISRRGHRGSGRTPTLHDRNAGQQSPVERNAPPEKTVIKSFAENSSPRTVVPYLDREDLSDS